MSEIDLSFNPSLTTDPIMLLVKNILLEMNKIDRQKDEEIRQLIFLKSTLDEYGDVVGQVFDKYQTVNRELAIKMFLQFVLLKKNIIPQLNEIINFKIIDDNQLSILLSRIIFVTKMAYIIRFSYIRKHIISFINSFEASLLLFIQDNNQYAVLLDILNVLNVKYKETDRRFKIIDDFEFSNWCESFKQNVESLKSKNEIQKRDFVNSFLLDTNYFKELTFGVRNDLFNENPVAFYRRINLFSEIFEFLPRIEEPFWLDYQSIELIQNIDGEIEKDQRLIDVRKERMNETMSNITNLIIGIEQLLPTHFVILKVNHFHFSNKTHSFDLSNEIKRKYDSIYSFLINNDLQNAFISFTKLSKTLQISHLLHFDCKNQFKTIVLNISKCLTDMIYGFKANKTDKVKSTLPSFISQFMLLIELIPFFLDEDKTEEHTQHLKTKFVIIVENIKLYVNKNKMGFEQLIKALTTFYCSIIRVKIECLYRNNPNKYIIHSAGLFFHSMVKLLFFARNGYETSFPISLYHFCLKILYDFLLEQIQLYPEKHLDSFLIYLNNDSLEHLVSLKPTKDQIEEIERVITYQYHIIGVVLSQFINLPVVIKKMRKYFMFKTTKFLLRCVCGDIDFYSHNWPFGNLMSYLTSLYCYAINVFTPSQRQKFRLTMYDILTCSNKFSDFHSEITLVDFVSMVYRIETEIISPQFVVINEFQIFKTPNAFFMKEMFIIINCLKRFHNSVVQRNGRKYCSRFIDIKSHIIFMQELVKRSQQHKKIIKNSIVQQIHYLRNKADEIFLPIYLKLINKEENCFTLLERNEYPSQVVCALFTRKVIEVVSQFLPNQMSFYNEQAIAIILNSNTKNIFVSTFNDLHIDETINVITSGDISFRKDVISAIIQKLFATFFEQHPKYTVDVLEEIKNQKNFIKKDIKIDLINRLFETPIFSALSNITVMKYFSIEIKLLYDFVVAIGKGTEMEEINQKQCFIRQLKRVKDLFNQMIDIRISPHIAFVIQKCMNMMLSYENELELLTNDKMYNVIHLLSYIVGDEGNFVLIIEKLSQQLKEFIELSNEDKENINIQSTIYFMLNSIEDYLEGIHTICECYLDFGESTDNELYKSLKNIVSFLKASIDPFMNSVNNPDSAFRLETIIQTNMKMFDGIIHYDKVFLNYSNQFLILAHLITQPNNEQLFGSFFDIVELLSRLSIFGKQYIMIVQSYMSTEYKRESSSSGTNGNNSPQVVYGITRYFNKLIHSTEDICKTLLLVFSKFYDPVEFQRSMKQNSQYIKNICIKIENDLSEVIALKIKSKEKKITKSFFKIYNALNHLLAKETITTCHSDTIKRIGILIYNIGSFILFLKSIINNLKQQSEGYSGFETKVENKIEKVLGKLFKYEQTLYFYLSNEDNCTPIKITECLNTTLTLIKEIVHMPFFFSLFKSYGNPKDLEDIFVGEEYGIVGMQFNCLKLCNKVSAFIKNEKIETEKELYELLGLCSDEGINELLYFQKANEHSNKISINESMTLNEIDVVVNSLSQKVKEMMVLMKPTLESVVYISVLINESVLNGTENENEIQQRKEKRFGLLNQLEVIGNMLMLIEHNSCLENYILIIQNRIHQLKNNFEEMSQEEVYLSVRDISVFFIYTNDQRMIVNGINDYLEQVINNKEIEKNKKEHFCYLLETIYSFTVNVIAKKHLDVLISIFKSYVPFTTQLNENILKQGREAVHYLREYTQSCCEVICNELEKIIQTIHQGFSFETCDELTYLCNTILNSFRFIISTIRKSHLLLFQFEVLCCYCEVYEIRINTILLQIQNKTNISPTLKISTKIEVIEQFSKLVNDIMPFLKVLIYHEICCYKKSFNKFIQSKTTNSFYYFLKWWKQSNSLINCIVIFTDSITFCFPRINVDFVYDIIESVKLYGANYCEEKKDAFNTVSNGLNKIVEFFETFIFPETIPLQSVSDVETVGHFQCIKYVDTMLRIFVCDGIASDEAVLRIKNYIHFFIQSNKRNDDLFLTICQQIEQLPQYLNETTFDSFLILICNICEEFGDLKKNCYFLTLQIDELKRKSEYQCCLTNDGNPNKLLFEEENLMKERFMLYMKYYILLDLRPFINKNIFNKLTHFVEKSGNDVYLQELDWNLYYEITIGGVEHAIRYSLLTIIQDLFKKNKSNSLFIKVLRLFDFIQIITNNDYRQETEIRNVNDIKNSIQIYKGYDINNDDNWMEMVELELGIYERETNYDNAEFKYLLSKYYIGLIKMAYYEGEITKSLKIFEISNHCKNLALFSTFSLINGQNIKFPPNTIDTLLKETNLLSPLIQRVVRYGFLLLSKQIGDVYDFAAIALQYSYSLDTMQKEFITIFVDQMLKNEQSKMAFVRITLNVIVNPSGYNISCDHEFNCLVNQYYNLDIDNYNARVFCWKRIKVIIENTTILQNFLKKILSTLFPFQNSFYIFTKTTSSFIYNITHIFNGHLLISEDSIVFSFHTILVPSFIATLLKLSTIEQIVQRNDKWLQTFHSYLPSFVFIYFVFDHLIKSRILTPFTLKYFRIGTAELSIKIITQLYDTDNQDSQNSKLLVVSLLNEIKKILHIVIGAINYSPVIFICYLKEIRKCILCKDYSSAMRNVQTIHNCSSISPCFRELISIIVSNVAVKNFLEDPVQHKEEILIFIKHCLNELKSFGLVNLYYEHNIIPVIALVHLVEAVDNNNIINVLFHLTSIMNGFCSSIKNNPLPLLYSFYLKGGIVPRDLLHCCEKFLHNKLNLLLKHPKQIDCQIDAIKTVVLSLSKQLLVSFQTPFKTVKMFLHLSSREYPTNLLLENKIVDVALLKKIATYIALQVYKKESEFFNLPYINSDVSAYAEDDLKVIDIFHKSFAIGGNISVPYFSTLFELIGNCALKTIDFDSIVFIILMISIVCDCDFNCFDVGFEDYSDLFDKLISILIDKFQQEHKVSLLIEYSITTICNVFVMLQMCDYKGYITEAVQKDNIPILFGSIMLLDEILGGNGTVKKNHFETMRHYFEFTNCNNNNLTQMLKDILLIFPLTHEDALIKTRSILDCLQKLHNYSIIFFEDVDNSIQQMCELSLSIRNNINSIVSFLPSLIKTSLLNEIGNNINWLLIQCLGFLERMSIQNYCELIDSTNCFAFNDQTQRLLVNSIQSVNNLIEVERLNLHPQTTFPQTYINLSCRNSTDDKNQIRSWLVVVIEKLKIGDTEQLNECVNDGNCFFKSFIGDLLGKPLDNLDYLYTVHLMSVFIDIQIITTKIVCGLGGDVNVFSEHLQYLLDVGSLLHFKHM